MSSPLLLAFLGLGSVAWPPATVPAAADDSKSDDDSKSEDCDSDSKSDDSSSDDSSSDDSSSDDSSSSDDCEAGCSATSLGLCDLGDFAFTLDECGCLDRGGTWTPGG